MTLRPIPTEKPAREAPKKNKTWNPGGKMKKPADGESFSLKTICLKLIRFINRGGRFTYQQIDEVIMALERGILSLRKKKQEIMKRRK